MTSQYSLTPCQCVTCDRLRSERITAAGALLPETPLLAGEDYVSQYGYTDHALMIGATGAVGETK